jgi:subtilisin-like proprotein convertase family protein
LYAQSADFNSIMYIQNGGLECSSVEIWFKAQDDCLRARICEIFTLAPGETYQFDANDCVGPDFVGNAWLRASQPMGIAVDIFGRDVLMTYVGVPTELNYTFDPNGALETTGNQVAYGPLIYSEYQGWDTGVQVQNMSSVVAAKVKVYFLDRSGDVITTLVDWICPRGSQTYFLPVVTDLPGNWVGSIRVESQEWFSPGDPLVAPPNITGIATMIKYTDSARTGTEEALAYNLLVEERAYDWQIGCCGGGLDSGIGLIAIPSVLKDLDNTGVTAELAIANLVPKPGFTDFAIYIYDQNGLIDYVCQKLNEKQVEYIDFDSWGYLNSGFKGSAIISAVFWEHDMFDDEGIFVRNLLGLAAVVVERTATRLGEDIPGDEAAGTAGIPFLQTDEEDLEFFFDFEGPVAPFCPGQPGFRQPPGQCPATYIAPCENCPFAIPDVQTVSSIININSTQIPTGCSIEDVDVLLDFTHTFNSDLTLDLSSPDLADVQLFSAICGATDNMQVILDDEAQQPIGGVCPPTGFQRFNTETPGNLTLFEGTASNGEWRLDVADQVGADVGQMLNWELQFTLGN